MRDMALAVASTLALFAVVWGAGALITHFAYHTLGWLQ